MEHEVKKLEGINALNSADQRGEMLGPGKIAFTWFSVSTLRMRKKGIPLKNCLNKFKHMFNGIDMIEEN